jgi:imidazolonepropionase-like amidohydrolase
MAAVRYTAARVFIGHGPVQPAWAVIVDGERITAAGPVATLAVPDGAPTVDLGDVTLLPGLIDLHSHVLLSRYDVTPWNDQVLYEPEALRVARATVALNATLQSGFTLLRDLGTEGAGYADVGLKKALERGIIPGPRMLVVTKAIVATGSYGPKGFAPECGCPHLGAEEADGVDALTRVVRDQIRRGADWIKVYADYYWGPHGEARPTFTLDELKLVVEIAESSGRHVAAHATTAEGMRRAALAGVRTIEHGSDGTTDVFALMAERGTAFCPTIAAYDAISRYRGWNGAHPEPPLIAGKRASFRAALDAGVTIANGSDVGVFDHGENARELELLVDYGMTPQAALETATSIAAGVVECTDTGTIAPGMRADLIAVAGDPLATIGALRDVRFVMLAGSTHRLAARAG